MSPREHLEVDIEATRQARQFLQTLLDATEEVDQYCIVPNAMDDLSDDIFHLEQTLLMEYPEPDYTAADLADYHRRVL